ncbi:LacI family DNA-binding transcriptional regulator [Streptomyces sp. TBY4]|uniref:LacI family DNA-binding transcriptional regulator n=1 Tax=Streptomyces sp. TBY4 TaxID=2962030 RepID=UPI0020B7B722|nr:LacI family DNA-binding transcriptional regulator [Streptomyces sp. TBY4]MCP3754671.1 LacI family transcriptional regulator [Streptomyces sp. TBY4]
MRNSGGAAPRRPTMKDVAREAGVSVSAASFALNDRPGVSDATRRRVVRVADRLGWRPSSAARALSGDRSGAVGLALARPADSLGIEAFLLQLVSGIQATLAPRHHALVFQMVGDVRAECELYRRWWAEGRVDGVIVVDPRVSDPRPEALAVLGLPAVVVGGMEAPRSAGTPPLTAHAKLSNLWADDVGAMDLIVRHLHGLGHLRIAHIAGTPGFAHTARRIASLRSTARHLGLEHAVSVTSDFTDRQGARAARLLLSAPAPPTALICDNEVIAMAALSVAAELGLRIPGDLSVVSWEDSALRRSLPVRLTSLVRKPDEFGHRAALELLALLDGDAPRQIQDPPPVLQARGSTAAPPA